MDHHNNISNQATYIIVYANFDESFSLVPTPAEGWSAESVAAALRSVFANIFEAKTGTAAAERQALQGVGNVV